MNPQEATEHDYPHDEEDCPACGGCEQIEIVFQDHSRDYVGCPICLARDKNSEIDRLRGDYEAMKWLALNSDETNDRLRAALARLESAAHDVYLPPEPTPAQWQELRDAAEQARIALGDEQQASAPKNPSGT